MMRLLQCSSESFESKIQNTSRTLSGGSKHKEVEVEIWMQSYKLWNSLDINLGCSKQSQE